MQPAELGQAKAQHAFNKQKAQQGNANKATPQPKTPKSVNFKKPKKFTPNKAGTSIRTNIKAGSQPLVSAASSSGSKPNTATAFHKR